MREAVSVLASALSVISSGVELKSQMKLSDSALDSELTH
jgi:hypothetical protein